ncbi:Maf family protein [Selenomonas sp. TAMA-11512]|uniref:Maf family protein n=1 Tax=Selenomonas sp. TAMA-11512 TaxID=3095337 RepID=UPI00308BE627|nr:Maf family protein [Selenomonas sp. TAMA-11512]
MIVLASASPRRSELLAQIGCAFIVETSAAEECMDGEPQEIACGNARKKTEATARHRAERGEQPLPVLAADTIVTLDGRIYGKPQDAEDAKAMLRTLAGRAHTVVTGLALLCEGKLYEKTVATRVYFASMSEAEIDAYAATGEPLDKAGGYAVQGRAAMYIERIEGSYSNVVGLPLHALRELAREAGVSLA